MLTIIFNYTVLLCCCLYYQPVFYRLSIIVLLSVRGFQIVYNYEKWSTLLSCRFQQVLKTKRWRFCNFNRKKKIFWDHFGNINKSFEWFIVLFFKATEQLLSIFPFTFLSFNFYFKSCWKTFDNFDDLLVCSDQAFVGCDSLFKNDISTFNPCMVTLFVMNMNTT